MARKKRITKAKKPNPKKKAKRKVRRKSKARKSSRRRNPEPFDSALRKLKKDFPKEKKKLDVTIAAAGEGPQASLTGRSYGQLFGFSQSITLTPKRPTGMTTTIPIFRPITTVSAAYEELGSSIFGEIVWDEMKARRTNPSDFFSGKNMRNEWQKLINQGVSNAEAIQRMQEIFGMQWSGIRRKLGKKFGPLLSRRNPCSCMGCPIHAPLIKKGQVQEAMMTAERSKYGVRRNPGWSFKNGKVAAHDEDLSSMYHRSARLPRSRRHNPRMEGVLRAGICRRNPQDVLRAGMCHSPWASIV